MTRAGAALRVIVVDDEAPARDELTFLLQQCEAAQVVGEAGFAAEAERLCETQKPQVAFIDLRMPGLDGLALAELLRKICPDLEIVIVSAHDEGAIAGFDARITDYLLKPVRLDRLRRTLERVTARLRLLAGAERLERFAVRRRGSYVVVDVRDVVYFESSGELVWAVTERDRFGLDRTLTTLADELDEHVYFQCHRSCIVRIDRIRTIEPAGARSYRLLLDHPDDPRVPLARDRSAKLRERILFLR
ncbi:MAG: response regulator transcription factor [Myxococcales bacterium]|nr:response regulator transcription factor [Myxococcales bacterium]